MDANLKISRANTKLLVNDPFHGSMAMGLVFRETVAVQTMATDGVHVFWNRSWVDRQSEDQVKGTIVHEIDHVLGKHHLRMEGRDPETWNIACDFAINPLVIKGGYVLPDGALISEVFENMSAERIYDLLPQPTAECPSDDDGDDTDGGGDQDGDSGDGWTKEELEDWGRDAPGEEQPGQDQPSEGSGRPQPQSWGDVLPATTEDGQQPSQADLDQMEADLDRRIFQAAQAAENAGKLPAYVAEIVKRMRQNTIDWRDVLLRFIGGDQPDDYTWRRPHRPTWFNQGIYMPSVERMGPGDIVIAVDTSGSVSTPELEHFLGEINAVTLDTACTSVTVITCDATVQSVRRYEQGEEIDMIDCKGRGGTKVQPVFDYVEDNDLDPASMVYLTDMGIWDYPENEPDYPVLWVSTCPNGTAAPFGETVEIKVAA